MAVASGFDGTWERGVGMCMVADSKGCGTRMIDEKEGTRDGE
jgi:hypothetical protein